MKNATVFNRCRIRSTQVGTQWIKLHKDYYFLFLHFILFFGVPKFIINAQSLLLEDWVVVMKTTNYILYAYNV